MVEVGNVGGPGGRRPYKREFFGAGDSRTLITGEKNAHSSASGR